ncbi:MAG: hypothetical protein AAB783_01520 [Patescibacteria group bacterium]
MKITFTLFTVLAVIFSLSSVGTTISYYQNIDKSTDNTLNSTILNLGVSASDFAPSEIGVGESTEKTATVANLGGIDFQYSVEANNFSEDAELCNNLDLVATLDGGEVFVGKLNTFTSPATTTHYSWQFEISLPPDVSVGNDSCNFDLVFKAWQTNIASYELSGYRDSETIQNAISSNATVEKTSPLRLLSEPESVPEGLEVEGDVEGEATSTPEVGVIEDPVIEIEPITPEVEAPEEVPAPPTPPAEVIEEEVNTEITESVET